MDLGQDPFQGTAHLVQNESVRRRDLPQCLRALVGQHQAIEQAPSPQEYRSASASAAQNRHVIVGASRFVNVLRQSATGSQNDTRLRILPHTQHLTSLALLRVEQQRLIEGQVFRKRGQGQIEKLHGGTRGGLTTAAPSSTTVRQVKTREPAAARDAGLLSL